MQELTNSINNASNEMSRHGSADELHEAGKKWAIYALDTFTGAFLTHALGVSKAIAEFTSVIKKDAPQE